MRTLIAILLTSAALFYSPNVVLSADLPVPVAGTWQGTLVAGDTRLRLVFQIAKDDIKGWHATVYDIDQSPDPIPATSVRVSGSSLQMTIDELDASYAGTVSADGERIHGELTRGGGTLQLDLQRPTAQTSWPLDSSAHTVRFVTVDRGVKLEVLDWGGSGTPLVFLAGEGATAHVFDRFAPKFTDHHHVYGITRRGFGDSSRPAPIVENFNADRLGDDVLAVIDALNLHKPVLVGHSIAGEELSSVCSRHPERVAGLIYLDAALGFAFYSGYRGAMALTIDKNELQRELELLSSPQPLEQLKAIAQQLLQSSLPNVREDLQDWQRNLEMLPEIPTERTARTLTYGDQVASAIDQGSERFTKLECPILAIFAWPSNVTMTKVVQAHALEAAVPSARVVRLSNAGHDVYRTNEAQVERAMNAFVDGLPKAD